MKEIFLTAIILLALPISAQAFSDVANSPYATAITELAAQHIITGYADNTFRPNVALNRTELLNLTYRARHLTPSAVSKACFFDVPKTAWYAPAVCDAKQRKIVSGYTDGSFQPGQAVTVASAAKIIAGVYELPLSTTQVSQWYAPYINALTQKHALPTRLGSPDKLLTRGEAAEILWRLGGGVPSSTDPLAQVSMNIPDQIKLPVPFTSQAPTRNWDPPFDEACEEAAVLMVEFYLSGKSFTSAIARDALIAATTWQTQQGYGVDITAGEAGELATKYYHDNAYVYTGGEVTANNIKRLLAAGHPVIIPVAGQLLDNPHFRFPGPPYHMIVLIGYTESDFISHDPGTAFGASYQYSQDTIMTAIHDWVGSKNTVLQGGKAMLVITK